MIAKTIINVGISTTPNETKKYPKYVGRKLLFANSISWTEVLDNLSLGSLLAMTKLNAVRRIGIAMKINHENILGYEFKKLNRYFSLIRYTTTIK